MVSMRIQRSNNDKEGSDCIVACELRNASVMASKQLEFSECYTRQIGVLLDDNRKFCTMFRNVHFMGVTHGQIAPNDVDQRSKNNSDNCHPLQME